MKVAVTCIQLQRDIDDWRSTFADAGLELHLPTIPGQYLEGQALIDALQGCVGVVAGDDQITAQVIANLPELRVISKWGSGIDGIDLAAAAEREIPVRNTPGMFNDEVADVTMAYIITLARHLTTIDTGVRAGGWPKPAGTSLNSSILGVVGLGGIGRAVAKRARVAGMHLLGFDPSPDSRQLAVDDGVEPVELDELFGRSDFISINCPLVPETRHLVNADSIATMKRGVRIINTGRGPVIDTDALVRGLQDGHIAAVALDVLEQEPPPAGHPLLSLPNVVLGSHNASNTLEASARVHKVAIDNLLTELHLERS